MAFGSTCDPSSQTHMGPFDPEVQIKLHWTWLQTFDAKISKILNYLFYPNNNVMSLS